MQFRSEVVRMEGALHVVAYTTTAHPSLWLAVRELKASCYILLDRCKNHSILHGRDIAEKFWMNIRLLLGLSKGL